MKSQLDEIMQTNQLDALMIFGAAFHNPAMFYLTGGGHVSHATLVKKAGSTPVLFHNPMERDEAAKSGLNTISLDRYNYRELVKEAGGNRQLAEANRLKKMLTDAGIMGGKIALYGQDELGPIFGLLEQFKGIAPEHTLIGYAQDPILLPAMMTKDPIEVERIRRVGKITTEVVGRVADLLTSSSVEDEVLLNPDGKPITIGQVKRQIDLWLAELGAENPEGTIFAIGRDAGVPHSSGNPADFIRLGKSIVFDIFPCEVGGGYFYDFTRTWSLGYATEDVQAVYQDVLDVYKTLAAGFKVNAPFKDYQKMTCDLFEAKGHPTIQTNPTTEEGYVHSLGHGVGLHVHEMPFCGFGATDQDSLFPGTVFTSEPGLYYPSRGLGVRLEDTYYTRPDGSFEILADFPLDLILPMKKK